MREYLDLLFPDSKVIEHMLDDGTVRKVDLNARGTMTLPGGDVIEVHSLPIVDMSENELALPIDPKGTTTKPAAASTVAKAEDLHRLNDLGIAYLLQDDPAEAALVFEEVTRLDPAYADGWVNLGRALVGTAEFDRALRELNAALNLKPGFPKARFFQGEVYRRRTEFALAEQAYEDVLKGFPLDRLSLLRLGEMLYEQGRYSEALARLLRLLEIDPENVQAWFWAQQCYKDLGDAERAAAADAAYDKYRPDDDEPVRAGEIHLAHPHLLRMSQPIHVHMQEGLDSTE
jgi:tetratricopeptide (TPR) repeat protein